MHIFGGMDPDLGRTDVAKLA